jgi:hypothetical protein
MRASWIGGASPFATANRAQPGPLPLSTAIATPTAATGGASSPTSADPRASPQRRFTRSRSSKTSRPQPRRRPSPSAIGWTRSGCRTEACRSRAAGWSTIQDLAGGRARAARLRRSSKRRVPSPRKTGTREMRMSSTNPAAQRNVFAAGRVPGLLEADSSVTKWKVSLVVEDPARRFPRSGDETVDGHRDVPPHVADGALRSLAPGPISPSGILSI